MNQMYETLADLDSLIILVRNVSSRSYIQDAVRAYQGGAFRASIVSTWIAVVVDFVEKLRELDLLGDAGAKAKLQEFDKAHASGDAVAALKFEQGILKAATDFEFLTPLEYLDLERLKDDRNRCAHPSVSAEGYYQPTPELARYHIRNAVVHLLRHPPVQGRAALERLLQEVDSELFPISLDAAVVVLSHGPLRNPRKSLARSFTVILVKEILASPPDRPKLSYFGRQLRLSAALNAMHRLHVDVVEDVFATTVPLLFRGKPDTELLNVISFLQAHSVAWDSVDPATLLRLENYIRALPAERLFPVLPNALANRHLRSAALERLQAAHPFHLGRLLEESLMHGMDVQDLLAQAVTILGDVQSWDSANALARPLTTQVRTLSEPQIEQIVSAILSNSEVNNAFGAVSLLRAIRESFLDLWESISQRLKEQGLERLIGDDV